MASDRRQEAHRGEIIAKGRARIKVRGRADFLEHLPEGGSVFPGELLLCPAQVAASPRQRSDQAGDSEFTEQLWKESCSGNSKQEGKPRTHLKCQQQSWWRQVVFTEQGKLKSFQVCGACAELTAVFLQAELWKLGCRSWKSRLSSLGKQRTQRFSQHESL